MRRRLPALVPGVIILLLGAAGLFYPERVLGLLGFTVQNASHAAAALGEVRATYGGIFLVMGVYTLVAAADPPRYRGRLVFVALLWLGACAGRLFGVWVDGNPGLPGWLAVAFEAAIGGALLLAGGTARRPAEPAAVGDAQRASV
jgi:hypothetical protein